MINNQNQNDIYSSKWINLAEERLGTKVLFATDDFFAEKNYLDEILHILLLLPDQLTSEQGISFPAESIRLLLLSLSIEFFEGGNKLPAPIL